MNKDQNQNQGWNWNWNWNWNENGNPQNRRRNRRSSRRHRWLLPVLLFLFFRHQIIYTARSGIRALFKGLSSGLSGIAYAVRSVLRVLFSGTGSMPAGAAVMGGLFIGVVIGILLYYRYFNKKRARAEAEEDVEAEVFAEEEVEAAEEEKLIMPCPSFVFSSDTDEDYTSQSGRTFGA